MISLGILDAFSGFIQSLINLLPRSPFLSISASVSSLPGLSWLCWFVPVADILTIFSAWLVAVGLYYILSVILRWVHIIR